SSCPRQRAWAWPSSWVRGSGAPSPAAPARKPRGQEAIDADVSLALVPGRVLPQHGRLSSAGQLAIAGPAALGHGGLAAAWPCKPVVAQGHLRHALRGARSGEATERRLPGGLQAPIGLGYLCPDPGVPRPCHGDEGGARLDSALRLVLAQVPAH